MLDIIGTLYDAGLYDEAGETIVAPAPLAGWHVNTTPEHMAAHPELDPFVITPTVLRRVWAGDDPEAPVMTVALQFADEAEGRTALGLPPA